VKREETAEEIGERWEVRQEIDERERKEQPV
jgi:hypothetical protein